MGVVSSANADYIELPVHYKLVKSGGTVLRPNYTSQLVPAKNAINYVNVIAIQQGAFLVGSYLSTSESCSQGAADDPMVCTTTTQSNIDTKFFNTNQKITDIPLGCSVAYVISGTTKSCPSNVIYPIVKDGTIDSSGNVVTNGGYDDTILKAKIKALEDKVYSCVQ